MQELEALVAKQRNRLTNQSVQISHLLAALAREKQKTAPCPAEARVVVKQEPVRNVGTQTPSKEESESTAVLQAIGVYSSKHAAVGVLVI